MTILITGASGFVGSYLALKFAEQKKKLILISNKKLLQIKGNTTKQCDINNVNKLELLFNKKIKYIIHCASLNESLTKNNVKLAYKTAIKGTENLLKLSIKYNIKKFFYFSVLQVYGKEITGKITSKNNLNIENDYAKSHYLAEEIIKSYGLKHKLNTNIIRLGYSFSCPINYKIKRYDLIPINFCLDAINKNKIMLNSNGLSRRDFISLKEIYKKIFWLLKNNNEDVNYFNFCSGKTFKIIEIAKMVKNNASKILKRKIKLIVNKKNKVKENKFKVHSDIYNKVNKNIIKKELIKEIKKILLKYKKL